LVEALDDNPKEKNHQGIYEEVVWQPEVGELCVQPRSGGRQSAPGVVCV
jgi:hypothetical protein